MFKKLSSLALCMVFLLGLMPNISLLAAEAKEKKPMNVVVGGTNVIAGGYWTTKDGKLAAGDKNNWNVRYDAVKHTLYLKNALVLSDEIRGIVANGDLSMVIEGNNRISGQIGIFIEGNLTIREQGAEGAMLKATGKDQPRSNPDGSGYGSPPADGIYVLGHLTLKSGTVIGVAGITAAYQCGVRAYEGITIKGGSLTGVAKNGYFINVGVASGEHSPEKIDLQNGRIVGIAEGSHKQAISGVLPSTSFYYRTKESGDWKLGPDASFGQAKLEYAELTTYIPVSYDSNGGTGEMAEAYLLVKTDKKSATLTVPKSEFTKYGYKFTGWKRSDNGEIVQPGARLEIAMKDLPNGFKLTAQWEKYTITEGADSTWQKGSGKDLTFKVSNGDFENFKEVQVDGKALGKDDYIAKAGSTIITLKSAYLETLSPGEHTITILYTDGSKTDAKVTVKEKEVVKTSAKPKPTDTGKNNNVPQTGDSSNILHLAAVPTIFAGVALVCLSIVKRKKFEQQ